MATIMRKLAIRIDGYAPEHVDFAARKLFLAAKMIPEARLHFISPAYLPTHTTKWTVNRSPFKYKRHRDTFEMNIHKRLVVFNAPAEIASKYTTFVKTSLPSNVRVRINEHDFYPVSMLYNVPKVPKE